MDCSRERDLSSRRGRQIATLILPALLFGVAELIGANAFIAAFVGGLVFGAASISLAEDHETADLLETPADLMGFVVWFLFGGLLLVVFEVGVGWQAVLIAVLALTVLRLIRWPWPWSVPDSVGARWRSWAGSDPGAWPRSSSGCSHSMNSGGSGPVSRRSKASSP